MRAIVGQQLSTKAARSIYVRLTERFDGRTPTPAQMLADDPEELRAAAGLSRAKVGYLRSLAEHVLSGELELERLDELDDETVIAELVAVKGIGDWTAHMFLMFHLQRPDVLPVGDLGIRRAIERAYELDELPDAADDRADRRAVAPAPHARLPLPVALAGQRAGVAQLSLSLIHSARNGSAMRYSPRPMRATSSAAPSAASAVCTVATAGSAWRRRYSLLSGRPGCSAASACSTRRWAAAVRDHSRLKCACSERSVVVRARSRRSPPAALARRGLLPEEVEQLLRGVGVPAGGVQHAGARRGVERLAGAGKPLHGVAFERLPRDRAQLALLGAAPEGLVLVVEDALDHVAALPR